ncbi:MAG: hypothetical protein ACI4F9_00850 [Lachnospiraceae bacterium]
MELLGKTLTEKVEKVYKEIENGLAYPVQITKLDVDNQEDIMKPCLFDPDKKRYEIKLDDALSDELFENALIRNMIYCDQMDKGAPMLFPVSTEDYEQMNIASMIHAVVLDINLEERLKEYDMYREDVNTMRMTDLFMFLKGDAANQMRSLYTVLAALQVTLLHFTATNQESINQIMESFQYTDEPLYTFMTKCIEIIEKYGCNTARGQMRCMRKIAVAANMKGKLKLYYEGKMTVL